MFTSVATLFALTASVRAIAFDGPLPTPINDLLFVDINGFSPKPTNNPRALPEVFRRQADDALCGYLEGDKEYPVSCSTGACMYNTVINWFGCCTGTVADSCNIATRCVGAAGVSSCVNDPSCSSDNYLLACTESSAPFCAQMYSVVSQNTVGHFVCARTSAVFEVLASTSGAASLGPSSGLASARSTPTPLVSSRSSTRRTTSSTSSEEEEEETSSVRVAATRTSASTTTAAASTNRLNTAASVSASTGGAAMQTARAIAGGLVGAVALWF